MATEIVHTSRDQYEYESDSDSSIETLDEELDRRVDELLVPPVQKEDRNAVSDFISYLIHDFERGWHRRIIVERIAQNYVAKKRGIEEVLNRVIYTCNPTKDQTWSEWFRGETRSKRDNLFTQAVLTPERETLLREMLENRFSVFQTRYLPKGTKTYFQWTIKVDRDTSSLPTEIRVMVEW